LFDKRDKNLSERQRKIINRMLSEGPNGFKCGMNVKKYRSITDISKATATRDLQELVEMNVIVIKGLRRSTSYEILVLHLNVLNFAKNNKFLIISNINLKSTLYVTKLADYEY